MTSRSLKFNSLFTAVILLLSFTTAFGVKRPTGTLSTQGKVTVNGSQTLPSSTLVSGSQISTKENSSAVVSLGPLGEIFVDANTDFVINFDDGGVKLELTAGSLRVKKSNPTAIEVLAKTCNQVEVMEGEVQAWAKGKKDKPDSQWTLNAGELREWKDKNGILSAAQSSTIDYKVSIIECNLAAAAVPRRIPPAVIFAGAGGGAAAIITPIVRSGSDDNPVSNSGP